MKVIVILDDDEAGYLSKLLKARYNKSRKTALSSLLILAAQEAALRETQEQFTVDKLEGVWSQPE